LTDYLNGLAHGESVAYDASGSTVRKAQYDKGRLHGDVVTYYPDGSIQSISPYQHDLLDGEVVKYAQDGSLIERMRYHAGKPVDPLPLSPAAKEMETARTA
jgi:antitoxin component YwqK of YwqJK toxin-antitoxin module